MKKKLLTIAILGITSIVGASTFKIGTGGATGNYFSMAKDIFSENYCQTSLGEENISEVLNSGGSVDNLNGLLNKKYSIGIIQADVLMSHAKKDPRRVNINRMKILSGLHIETVHLLIPKGYQPEKAKSNASLLNSFSDMFNKKKKPVKISLDVLKNQRIASWGGSVVSANALSYFFGLNWNVISVPKDNREKISDMPILLVGGQPYAPVEKYLTTGNYKLIGLNYKEISNKAPFYMPVEATYSTEGKIQSVPSVGIQALLVGKAFRKESRNEPMQLLSQCIDENLSDLADDTDTNPNWNSVYELNEQGSQINWSYFNIN